MSAFLSKYDPLHVSVFLAFLQFSAQSSLIEAHFHSILRNVFAPNDLYQTSHTINEPFNNICVCRGNINPPNNFHILVSWISNRFVDSSTVSMDTNKK